MPLKAHGALGGAMAVVMGGSRPGQGGGQARRRAGGRGSSGTAATGQSRDEHGKNTAGVCLPGKTASPAHEQGASRPGRRRQGPRAGQGREPRLPRDMGVPWRALLRLHPAAPRQRQAAGDSPVVAHQQGWMGTRGRAGSGPWVASGQRGRHTVPPGQHSLAGPCSLRGLVAAAQDGARHPRASRCPERGCGDGRRCHGDGGQGTRASPCPRQPRLEQPRGPGRGARGCTWTTLCLGPPSGRHPLWVRTHRSAQNEPPRPVNPAASPAARGGPTSAHHGHKVQQVHARLVGLGVGQLQQRGEAEADGAAGVAALGAERGSCRGPAAPGGAGGQAPCAVGSPSSGGCQR